MKQNKLLPCRYCGRVERVEPNLINRPWVQLISSRFMCQACYDFYKNKWKKFKET